MSPSIPPRLPKITRIDERARRAESINFFILEKDGEVILIKCEAAPNPRGQDSDLGGMVGLVVASQ
jgi:hypothetical protein